MPELDALGQQLLQHGLRILGDRTHCGCRVVFANQAAQLAVMVLLIFDDLLQNGHARLVSEVPQLLPIPRDVAALVYFEPAQRQARTSRYVRQRVRISRGLAVVFWNCAAKLPDPLRPQRRMMGLCLGHLFQNALANWVAITRRERLVGVKAAHLRLPVLRQRSDHLAICVLDSGVRQPYSLPAAFCLILSSQFEDDIHLRLHLDRLTSEHERLETPFRTASAAAFINDGDPLIA